MKPKFAVIVAHEGRPVPCDWHIAMTLLQYPTNSSHVYIWRKGMEQDEALNDMTEEALASGAEYILSIDDDTQLPQTAILALSSALENSEKSVMACGGIYTTKTNPPEPIVYKEKGQGAYWDWKIGDVFPCFALGNGCLMVRSQIFREMPRPWYKYIKSVDELAEHAEWFPSYHESNPRMVSISPDIFFFTKLEKMGYKALAHGGVLPIHWDGRKSFWMPANTKPTDGVLLNGKTFGWTDPSLRVLERELV